MQSVRKPMTLLIAMAMALSLAPLGSSAARAADIFVEANGDLQAAIDAAGSGDTLHLAAGVYSGGFSVAGKTLTLIGAAADAAPSEVQTYLDGGNTRTVMRVAGDADLTLSGLGVQNGRNVLPNGMAGPGGGVANSGALTLSRCFLTGCYSDRGGGAVLNLGTMKVLTCLFVSNSAYAGGAISNGAQFPSPTPGISAVIANSTFANGFSAMGGAISNTEQLLMTNCVLSGNVALYFGGALINLNKADVYNCTFTGNVAVPGAGGLGGAICNGLAGFAATLSVTNSILWADVASDPTAAEIGCHPNPSVVTTAAYSDIEGGLPPRVTDGGNNSDADPQLGPTFELAATSPCINAGDNSVVSAANGYPQVAGQSVDILGNPRITGGVVDMGAAEFQSSVLTLADATVRRNNDKTLTVTVLIGNPNQDTDYDVTVTAASLDGSDTNSVLPLVFGAIKPGTDKKCTLQFKDVPSGDQTLTVFGVSSLGAFFTTQTVTVP
jgi:hypothetical protein